MKRSDALAALSRDHHHALVVAQRLRRAGGDDLDSALADLEEFWAGEGERHFELEEQHLAAVLDDDEWRAGIERMRREHEVIRAGVAGVDGVESAHRLGTLLHDHVRFEERELFPLLERRLPEPELLALGESLAAG